MISGFKEKAHGTGSQSDTPCQPHSHRILWQTQRRQVQPYQCRHRTAGVRGFGHSRHNNRHRGESNGTAAHWAGGAHRHPRSGRQRCAGRITGTAGKADVFPHGHCRAGRGCIGGNDAGRPPDFTGAHGKAHPRPIGLEKMGFGGKYGAAGGGDCRQRSDW